MPNKNLARAVYFFFFVNLTLMKAECPKPEINLEGKCHEPCDTRNECLSISLITNTHHCYRVRTHYMLSSKLLSDDEINKAGTDKEYFEHLCFYDTNMITDIFGRKIIKSEKGYEVWPLSFNCDENKNLHTTNFCVKNTVYDLCLGRDTKNCSSDKNDASCVVLKLLKNKKVQYRLPSLCLTPIEESALTKFMHEIGYLVSQDDEKEGGKVKFADDLKNSESKKKEDENEANTKENAEQSDALKRTVTESEKNNDDFSKQSPQSELIVV